MNKPRDEKLRDEKFRVLNMARIELFPDVFEPLAGIAEVESLPPDAGVLLERIGEFDVYFASLEVPITREIIDAATRLRVITTPTTGTDHIEMEYAKSKGIEVLTLKEEIAFLDSITATAEMAWTLMLAVARKLPWSFEAAKRGQWARDRFRGRQLSGKTLGILGYGRLGRIMAEYGNGFRMRVIACDRRAVEAPPNVELVDFETLLRESDVFSIHIHLTPENHHLIDAAALSKMKPDAILLNTSRGAIIDEAALVEALENNKLGGAGLDVIHGEWDENLQEHPLIRYANAHENLVISPHTGGITLESQSAAMRFMAEKLARFLR